MLVTGPTNTIGGFDNTTTQVPSVTYYVETVPGGLNVGWYRAQNISHSLESGLGYQVIIRGDRSSGMNSFSSASTTATTLSLKGALHQGNYNLPVTYTNTNQASIDGWNLVGNPYASQIDWNEPSAWTKTNIEDAIYIWDPGTANTITTTLTGTYFAVVGGISSDGRANPSVIPSSQGFFVKANAANPSLSINENAKVDFSHLANFRTESTAPQGIRIKMEDSTQKVDYAVIRLSNDATTHFDNSLDARKLRNTSFNIYTLADSLDKEQEYAINSIPLEVDSVRSIPLVIEAALNKPLHLTFQKFGFDSTQYEVWLHDKMLNDTVPLIYNQKMLTYSPSQTVDNRFEILLKTARQEEVTSSKSQSKKSNKIVVYPVPVRGNSLFIQNSNFNSNDIYTVEIVDLLGRTSYKGSQKANPKQELEIDVQGLGNGSYMLKISTNEGVNFSKFFITR
jgi:hypothetical protein